MTDRNYDHLFLAYPDQNSQRMEAQLRYSILERILEVKIHPQVNGLEIEGHPIALAGVRLVLETIWTDVKKPAEVDEQMLRYLCELAKENRLETFLQAENKVILVTPKGMSVRGKTIGQCIYIDAVRKNEMVFCIGPAGCGKTYLGVALAVAALRAKEVSRLIFTRPAVEAGERLGFLPGDLKEKVDPYMQPVYDALQTLLGEDLFMKYLDRRVIEVSPLAFMRGRTLDDAFILLDEAQNTTVEQMKMFLTRVGMNAKACICGDITQIDLPRGVRNGLSDAVGILSKTQGISVVSLTESDIVRNPLVQRIVKAYNSRDKIQEEDH